MPECTMKLPSCTLRPKRVGDLRIWQVLPIHFARPFGSDERISGKNSALKLPRSRDGAGTGRLPQ